MLLKTESFKLKTIQTPKTVKWVNEFWAIHTKEYQAAITRTIVVSNMQLTLCLVKEYRHEKIQSMFPLLYFIMLDQAKLTSAVKVKKSPLQGEAVLSERKQDRREKAKVM